MLVLVHFRLCSRRIGLPLVPLLALLFAGTHGLAQERVSSSAIELNSAVASPTVRMQLAGKEDIVFSQYGGNTAIADRYALVWRQRGQSSELIDLATGESVFGELQVSGWIH